jgi:hypothetical protein
MRHRSFSFVHSLDWRGADGPKPGPRSEPGLWDQSPIAARKPESHDATCTNKANEAHQHVKHWGDNPGQRKVSSSSYETRINRAVGIHGNDELWRQNEARIVLHLKIERSIAQRVWRE